MYTLREDLVGSSMVVTLMSLKSIGLSNQIVILLAVTTKKLLKGLSYTPGSLVGSSMVVAW